MKRYLLIVLVFLLIEPLDISAKNFPHISTFGYDYWNLTKDIEQVKWIAKRHDWVVGGVSGVKGEVLYNTMKSVNPNVKFMPYIAYNTYEKDVQDWIRNWCERNGYNFEDTFYHYYYDTEIKLRRAPHKVFIKGYGGGTAKTIQESRVPSSWASYNSGIKQSTGEITRFNINPTSKVCRLGFQVFALETMIKINPSVGKYTDGLFLDTFDGTVYNAYDLQLERTTEMRNLAKHTRGEANAQASNDLIVAMIELKTYLTNQVGRPILTVPNTGDIDSFYEWRKFLYEDRISDYSHVMVKYMDRAGSGN